MRFTTLKVIEYCLHCVCVCTVRTMYVVHVLIYQCVLLQNKKENRIVENVCIVIFNIKSEYFYTG